MTLDERLERLTERHEALTQSVELIVAGNRQAAEKMAGENKQLSAENRQSDRRLVEIMEGIASLLDVAEIPEQRLDSARLSAGQPAISASKVAARRLNPGPHACDNTRRFRMTELKALIREVPGFPKPGILFRSEERRV